MGSFSILQWLILGLIAFGIYSVFKGSGNNNPKVCKACGHVSSGSTVTRGSILIEIILWLCFIVPGLIYSIWRHGSRYRACASCGSAELIPVDSPIGRKIIESNNAPTL